MKWFLRFILWTAALAYPCTLLAGPYQNLLLAMVTMLFGVPFHPDPRAGADLAASNMLGVYASMCLASTAAPWAPRLKALGLGLLAMTVIEWATGLLSIGAGAFFGEPQTWAPAAQKAFDAVIALPRFTSAPALWLLFLSRYELPYAWRAPMTRLGGTRPAETRAKV
jgi:hypothetical protein